MILAVYLLLQSEVSNITCQSSSLQTHLKCSTVSGSLQTIFLAATIVLCCISAYIFIVISVYDIDEFNYSV